MINNLLRMLVDKYLDINNLSICIYLIIYNMINNGDIIINLFNTSFIIKSLSSENKNPRNISISSLYFTFWEKKRASNGDMFVEAFQFS